jgi:hypothetical protein
MLPSVEPALKPNQPIHSSVPARARETEKEIERERGGRESVCISVYKTALQQPSPREHTKQHHGPPMTASGTFDGG